MRVSEATLLCLEREVRPPGRHGGPPDAQREDENMRLRRLVADLTLDKQMLAEALLR